MILFRVELFHAIMPGQQRWHVRSLMKCRLDGPTPANVAQHARCAGSVQVIPSPFCIQVQREYTRLFGEQQKGCRQEMPRRVLPQGPKPGLPSLKRKRQEEMSELRQSISHDAAPDEAKAELMELEQIVAKEAAKRATESQESLSCRLRKYAEKQRRNMAADGVSNDSVAETLKTHQEKAEKELQRCRECEPRTFAARLNQAPLPFGTLVVATKAERKEALQDAGADFMLWPEHAPDALKACADLLRSTWQPVWLCSPKEEKTMMFEPSASIFTSFAVLIGGHVGAPGWVTAVKEQKRLVPCLLSLGRGLAKALHLHLHKSLNHTAEAAAKAVAISNAAAQPIPGVSAWNVVAKWKDM